MSFFFFFGTFGKQVQEGLEIEMIADYSNSVKIKRKMVS